MDWLRDVRQIVDLGYLDVPGVYRWSGAVGDDQSAREAALACRERLGAGLGPLGPIIDVCERLGLLVLVTGVSTEGASLADGDLAVALVADRQEPGRRRATAAHELGHQVLGDEYSADLGVAASRDDRECVIDVFAAELLLPTAAVEAAWPAQAEEADGRSAAVRLAATYRVSWSLLLRQLHRCGVLQPGWRARWSAKPPTRAELLDASGWDQEPQEDLPRGQVPPRYASGVFDAYRAGKFTSARAVELLHGWVSEDDLPEQDLPDPSP